MAKEQQRSVSDATPLLRSKPLPFPLGLVPASTHPYLELMRMDKPTGTWLVFWPFAWGLTMAARTSHLPIDVYAIELVKALFFAFLTRSFACTVNDIFDYKFDVGVERTKTRPLASGRVSRFNASIFAIAQALFAAGIFAVGMNPTAFWAAIIQLLPLSCVYPLLKRVTYWPQAWLGLAINFGVVIAWAAITGDVDYPVCGAVLAALWSWTILYDTIYACQDKKDDLKVGVRSTALLFGTYIRPLLTLFGLAFALALAGAGYLNEQGLAFYAVAVGGTSAHLVWQYVTVDLEDPASCKLNFVKNGQLGWIVWAGLALDYVLTGPSSRFL